MKRISQHWVIQGDSAQEALTQQGYRPEYRQRRYGVVWVLMTKEVGGRIA